MHSQITPGARPSNGSAPALTISKLPKSSVFTDELPPDAEFPTPKDSHSAARDSLGPRLVKGALYTYVRPENAKEPELLVVSRQAMQDLGLAEGSENEDEFRETVAGNRILTWDEEQGKGIYPWAQCYGGKVEAARKSLLLTNPKDINCATSQRSCLLFAN
jgi:serine/tyrosine/threonine adenylyltransferase